MTVSINGTNGLTFNDGSTQTTSPFTGGFGFRNRIINGACVIDQRNAGAAVTQTTSVVYTVDRWSCYGSVASKFTVQRSTTAPAGFTNSLLVTSSSAYTVGASEFFFIQQVIEGFNVADLGWGTANAQTVTLSFQVRSSLTGTFGGTISNGATNRVYPFTFTISAANTSETKTITIAGDTTGTWSTDNSGGIVVNFNMGAGASVSGTAGAWSGSTLRAPTGATSVVGTSGATFYITGVQLEKGSTATSFDYRPFGTELQLCQRYFQIYVAAGSQDTVSMGNAENTTRGYFLLSLPVSMRTAPACTLTATNFSMRGTTSFVACTSGSMGGVGGLSNSFIAGEFQCGSAHGAPTGGCVKLTANTTASTIQISSEL
ncbi:hypothetical protein UFOVP713_15 [uncultured Caudovirales phage]|uniref:Uncharacterized protein n=1 Tax=uncultured Caudovirales phage TaxID=2100421 RepID=A0A6J5NI48_9CAUD|nr:hypothetical protein UFOVP713_15 [uncultured Caudovirales phage]